MAAGIKVSRIGKFELNPRGNLWVQDENTFGHKLLKKMGWNKGEGLGKNGDGIFESLKVRRKTSNTGLGFKDKVPLGIDEQEYDSILLNLNKKHNLFGVKDKSQNLAPGLEHRSNQFRNRLIYRKFIRGKDICRYSERDMNSIFLKSRSKGKELDTYDTKQEPKLSENDTTTHMYDSQINIKDYFAQKLKKIPNDSSNKNVEQINLKNVQESCVALENNQIEKPLHLQKNQAEEFISTENSTRKKRKLLSDENEITKKPKLCNLESFKESDAARASSFSIIAKKEHNDDLVVVAAPDPCHEKMLDKGKKKPKHSKIQTLKSCLKKSINSLKLNKKVSFNKDILYKTIESNFSDKNETLNDFHVTCNFPDQIPVNTDLINKLNHSDDTKPSSINTIETESTMTELDDVFISDISLKDYKCLDLPKCDNLNYNSWLETQRQAIKLTLYKNIIKNIKRHRVLQTTNLLDIKGYGNWGL